MARSSNDVPSAPRMYERSNVASICCLTSTACDVIRTVVKGGVVGVNEKNAPIMRRVVEVGRAHFSPTALCVLQIVERFSRVPSMENDVPSDLQTTWRAYVVSPNHLPFLLFAL